jgi:hypothetical protein
MIENIWSDFVNWTTQYVVPDWGTLVGLIPILLPGLAFLYVTWTIYRSPRPGPRRGKQRLTPVPARHPPSRRLARPAARRVRRADARDRPGVGGLAVGRADRPGITLLYWGRGSC